MTPELSHSFILIGTFAITFILAKTPFADYQLQFTGILFILYYVLKKMYFPTHVSRMYVFDSVLFSMLILSIVNTTGEVTSPYFFLNYFLIFALTLLLEPVISITTSITLIIFYILSLKDGSSFVQLIPVFSLGLFAPFALFLGTEYKTEIRERKKMNELNKNVEQKTEEVNELKKETLLFFSLELKDHVQKIYDISSSYVSEREIKIIRNTSHRALVLIQRYFDSLK